MENELVNLQRRVAELEAALAAVAAQQRPWRRSWRMVRVGVFCAGIVAIGLAVTLATRASATLTPQGPSKVVAPFEVFDNKGQRLFAVVADPGGGGGNATIWATSGVPATVIRATPAGNGELKIMSGELPKISLGVLTSSAGSIYLFSNTPARTIINGDAGIRQTNAQGQPVAQLYVDENGQGSFLALNRAGVGMSKLSVAADGSSGLVEVSQGGEIKATMGVKEGGKGDLCVEGRKGLICLSGVAIKSLIPW
jgi:hypothetical protein